MADEDFSKEESEEELYVPLKLKRGVKTKKMVTVNLKDMEDEDFWKEDSEEQMSVPLKSKRRVKTKKMEYEGWGSKPLIEFLKEIGVETENKISQQDLTTIVNKYVAEKKLNNKVRKNRVNCDNWLRYLFGKKFVLRIKIHELLYSHLAENRDESEDEDSNNSEEDENKTAASRKRKVFCLNSKKLPETPTSCFASIIPENIKLLYLRRSLIEELLKDHDTFESKVVGSYVRIKCDPNDCSQKNSHQLLQVTGVRKAPECGDGGAEYFLEAAHFFKEILVSELSNENFKMEECDDLRHRIITGSFSRPTVMEFEQKAQILHKLITKQRISRELSLLQNQIEHANIKGWRRELYEYLQRKELLQKPAEQERLLLEVPNVIAEPLEPEAIVHEPAEDENTDMFCLPQSTIAGNLEDVPFNTEEDKSLSNDSLCGKDAAGVEISDKMSHRRRHKILMVSDFYYPNFGGVENHIYYLSQCLLNLGHKVVVMTHAYGNRSGVRYVTGGLKVYYVPWVPFLMQNTFPTLYGTLPIIRTILVRERISLVHGHQAFSTLCNEALMHARTMGYKVVFTDHSLYGFADVGSIHMNKVLQFTLADVSQAICVSHTSKENTVLRSGLPPEKVFVIPNAVDTSMFKPAPKRLGSDEIIIVVISRLVYRKGADLLVEVIPGVCRLFPNVRFIVGGDGPKRVRLEEMREKHSLQDRVDMLGAVPHAKVQSVLISGHIFLNSSLTEAFCIAILEAASCGLLTVSTRVGGVPEVLPDDMIVLAEPDPDDMVQAIAKAIHKLPQINPQDMHRRMKSLYSWHDVAKRTEIVYDRALRCSDQNLLERLSRYLTCGSWAGKLFCLVMIIDYLLWHLLQLWKPDSHIEEVPDIMYGQQGEKPGDFV